MRVCARKCRVSAGPSRRSMTTGSSMFAQAMCLSRLRSRSAGVLIITRIVRSPLFTSASDVSSRGSNDRRRLSHRGSLGGRAATASRTVTPRGVGSPITTSSLVPWRGSSGRSCAQRRLSRRQCHRPSWRRIRSHRTAPAPVPRSARPSVAPTPCSPGRVQDPV